MLSGHIRSRGPDTRCIRGYLEYDRTRAVELVGGSAWKRVRAQVDAVQLRQHCGPGRLHHVVDDRDRAVDPNDLPASGRRPRHAVWGLLRNRRLLHHDGRSWAELNRDLAFEHASSRYSGKTDKHEPHQDQPKSPQRRPTPASLRPSSLTRRLKYQASLSSTNARDPSERVVDRF